VFPTDPCRDTVLRVYHLNFCVGTGFMHYILESVSAHLCTPMHTSIAYQMMPAFLLNGMSLLNILDEKFRCKVKVKLFL
jgi:hypothetical protein